MEIIYLWKVILPAAAVVVLSVITILKTPSETTIPIPPVPSDLMIKANESKGIAVVGEKLFTPWSIAISKDGRGFFTERVGIIRAFYLNGTLQNEPVAHIRVAQIGEGGLLGLALHPNFTLNHKMYVYQTYSNASGIFNKILILREYNGQIVDSTTLLDGIPGASFHDGGRIKFGPDDKLYISTGDAENPELAQDRKSLAGKILRINDDGTIPGDNPFAHSPVYALGLRNVQGLAWDPKTKVMYAADHGASGNDELDIVHPGSNYGWPREECSSGGNFQKPVICFNPAIAPSGITLATSNKLGYKGDLILATLKGSQLRSINLTSGEQNNILVGYGRLRDVVESPDGSLYVLTSNTDGRGLANANDDKILKIFKQ